MYPGAASDIELQYRVDNNLWHPFTEASELIVDDPSLRVPGEHRIEVRARFAGQPMSLDPTPSVIEIVIDEEAPFLELTGGPDDQLLVTVGDAVSEPEDIMLRYRTQHRDGTTAHWTAWTAWTTTVTG